jgi:hypothetical protein
MFSYLTAVRSVVDPNVYARGIKLYLQGSVLSHTEMTLDFWRKYVVAGSAQSHTVQMPLLHLALARHKYDLGGQAMVESTRCDCAYFQEFGICKHIVAVCAQLEQEFAPPSKVVSEQIQASVLDNIFQAEADKKIRVWLSKVEDYLAKDSQGQTYWWEEVATFFRTDPSGYEAFWSSLAQMVEEATKTWEKEARLLPLIYLSLQLGGARWWDFWQPYLSQISQNRMEKLLVDLWKLKVIGACKNFEPQLLDFLSQLHDQQKEQTLRELQKVFPHSAKFWLDFVFESKFESWVDKNYQTLDPLSLIKAVEMLPDRSEKFELEILRQVRIWSDFLQTGQYDDLIQLFQVWQRRLGRSQYFEQALKYLQENHPKKKKLLRQLEA